MRQRLPLAGQFLRMARGALVTRARERKQIKAAGVNGAITGQTITTVYTAGVIGLNYAGPDLALGLDAIYAHWGGSHFAYDKLDKGIINNIDAMKDWYGAYYRKSNILAPHNGFTSMEKLLSAIKKSKYRNSRSKPVNN